MLFLLSTYSLKVLILFFVYFLNKKKDTLIFSDFGEIWKFTLFWFLLLSETRAKTSRNIEWFRNRL